MDIWEQWYEGVMAGISAPVNSITQDVMWAWSEAETRPYLVTHINNPLDTTQWEPGATAWNTFGNNQHVWSYPTIEEGIQATVTTLLNGYYPNIVAHLRNSIPRSQWGDVCIELGRWGTGCSWLATDYGAASGTIGGNDVTLDPNDPTVKLILNEIDQVQNLIERGTDAFPGYAGSAHLPTSSDLLAAIQKIQSATAPVVDNSAVLAAIADLKAHPSVVADPVLSAKIDALSRHLGIGSP